MWLRKAKSKLDEWESTDAFDRISGEHDGYVRLKDSVIHKRSIFFDKPNKTIKVNDIIKANEKHLIEQFFLFSSDCVALKVNENIWQIENNGCSIGISVDRRLNSESYCGITNPILDWESKRFEVRNKTTTMVNRLECVGDCELETIININH